MGGLAEIQKVGVAIAITNMEVTNPFHRDNAPTKEELVKNLSIMDIKKRNAAKLDAEHAKIKDTSLLEKEQKGMGSFPKYKEYESIPGKDGHKND